MESRLILYFLKAGSTISLSSSLTNNLFSDSRLDIEEQNVKSIFPFIISSCLKPNDI